MLTRRIVCLAVVAVLHGPAGARGDDLPIPVTQIAEPLLSLNDPLLPHDGGLLFISRDPFFEPSVWTSGGTRATTRRIGLRGRPYLGILGQRGQNAFLSAAKEDFRFEVLSLNTRTGHSLRLSRGTGTPGVSTASGFFFPLPWAQATGLYRTDGTAAGTTRVFSGEVREMTSVGKDALFCSPLEGGGFRIYRTRGRSVVTLGDFEALEGFESTDPLGSPTYVVFAPFGRQAAFLRATPDDITLMIADGNADEARPVYTTSPFYGMGPAGSCGNNLLFFPHPPNEPEVWATDGTVSGTRLLASLPAMAVTSFGVADAGGTCYFLVGDPIAPQLWKTDGTPEGTTYVTDIDASFGLSRAQAVGARGRVFFPEPGALWTSDGTAGGTHALASGLAGPSRLVRSGDHVFFMTSEDPEIRTSLWAAELPPGLVIEDAEGREKGAGRGAILFPVRLSRRAEVEVVVHYATESGTAEAGTDFVPAAGELHFRPGERLKLLRIEVPGDGVREGAESFNVRLSAPTGAEIERGLGTGTIRDSGTGLPGPRP